MIELIFFNYVSHVMPYQEFRSIDTLFAVAVNPSRLRIALDSRTQSAVFNSHPRNAVVQP